MRDVTERSRLERKRSELQQCLRRTEALRSLAVMAGGVAHDFNNLLSGVIGSTELGLLRLEQSQDSVRSCLEEAHKFVPKPHGLANLGAALRHALESERTASSARAGGVPAGAGDATAA